MSEEENLEEVYNEMFSYRYTDKDREYVETISKPQPPGPCVDNYFNRPKRNYDQVPKRDDRDRGGRGGWRGGHQRDNRGQGYRNNRGEERGYRDNRGNFGYDRDRHGGRDNRDYRDRHNRYHPY